MPGYIFALELLAKLQCFLQTDHQHEFSQHQVIKAELAEASAGAHSGRTTSGHGQLFECYPVMTCGVPQINTMSGPSTAGWLRFGGYMIFALQSGFKYQAGLQRQKLYEEVAEWAPQVSMLCH